MNATASFQIERVELSHDERRRLLAHHQRIDYELRDVWDEDGEAVVTKEVPLPIPVCCECGDPWGEDGCSTVRAVTLLAIHERTIAAKERRIAELTEAVSPRFGVERLREGGNRIIALGMRVDEYTLLYARIDVIDDVLGRMRAEWKAWFKKVGDLQRIRADHEYALTLDSAYYAHLTQEFDAWAPATKRQGAPWDSADWVAPSPAPGATT